MNIAEKVVRIDVESYGFVVDFANKHDLRIGEAVSLLIEYCSTRELSVKKAFVEVVEERSVVADVLGE